MACCLSLAAPAGAESPEMGAACAEQMQISGQAEVVVAARTALARGLRAKLDPACKDARLFVSRRVGEWHFRMTLGARSNEHAVTELDSMVTWIESWLAVPVEPTAVAASVAVPQERVGAPPMTQPQPQSNPRATLTLGGIADFDALGPVWGGAELGLRTRWAPNLWLGVAGAGVRAPTREQVRREALRLSARLGWLQPFAWGAPFVAGGVGVVAGHARRRLPGGASARDEEVAPFIEVSGGVELRLAGDVALSIALLGRAHLPDDYAPDDDPPEERFEPDPLPDVAASLGVGVAFGFGGSP